MSAEGDELDLPDEIYGFASWLLWLIATRSPALVDRVFRAGLSRPSRTYGMVGSHHVPTPALVAWLLVAAEYQVPADDLRSRNTGTTARHKVLRTMASRAINADPRVFKARWLDDLAAICGLSPRELELLLASRGDGHHPVDTAALRSAIARTLRARGEGTTSLASAEAKHTLPRDIGAFVGRDLQLQQVSQQAEASSLTATAGVCSITGMAGAGKTALAIHAAHRLTARFPDGQIFVTLHGHTPGQPPAQPADVLSGLLLTAGVSAERIPPDLEPRMRLWRDRLAGKRVLLVLDDAVGHEQVQPLLPGTGGSLVIVTSRRRLTALADAVAISLDTLPAADAAELLARLADRPGLGAQDVSEIAQRGGYLPLAMSMLGRQLHHHPAWSPAYLATRLAAERGRLGLMTAENVSVAASFQLSYQDLPADGRRLFRRLGLHPGSDFDAWSAAALDGTDPGSGHRELDTLYDHHLVAEPAAGRYRFHDLIREHARSLASADPAADQAAAQRRLLDYYWHAAFAAGGQLAGQRRTTVAAPIAAGRPRLPDLRSADKALAWMDAELTNLEMAVDYAAAHDLPAHAAGIPAAMHGYLYSQGHWDQGIRMHATAVAAARAANDRGALAQALANLGALQASLADLPAATASQTEALQLCQGLNDQAGAAVALIRLGSVQTLTGDYPAAAASLTQALKLCTNIGDRAGRAEALARLGFLRYRADDYVAAEANLNQALALHAAEHDSRGQLGTLNYLALVQQEMGRYPAAAASFTAALELCLLLADRNAEAAVRAGLGHLQCVTGELDTAIGNLTRALGLHEALGNRLGQAQALNSLGLAQRLTGQHVAAVSSQEQALSLFRACGSRAGEANALQELGNAQQQACQYRAAAASQEAALDIYRGLRDLGGQAETLNNLGELLRASGQPSQARAYHEQALHLAGGFAAPVEQARALEGIGRADLHERRLPQAGGHLREALAIYQQLGSPQVSQVETLLRDCVSAPQPATTP